MRSTPPLRDNAALVASGRVQRNQPRVQTNLSGYVIVVGAVFIALGAVMFFEVARRARPGFVLAAQLFAADFVLLGVSLAVASAVGMLKRRRARRAGGIEAWHYDHKWDVNGARDEEGSIGLRMIQSTLLIAFFVLPFHLIFLTVENKDRWMLYAMLGFFDVILFAFLATGVSKLLRRRKFGARRIRFDRFPYLTNAPIRLVFDGGAMLANAQVDLRLQNVREQYETTGRGRSRTRQLVMELVAEQVHRVKTDAAGVAAVTFDAPRGAGTDLIGRAPCYWELHAAASRPGLDYEGTFLLPIYAPAITSG